MANALAVADALMNALGAAHCTLKEIALGRSKKIEYVRDHIGRFNLDVRGIDQSDKEFLTEQLHELVSQYNAKAEGRVGLWNAHWHKKLTVTDCKPESISRNSWRLTATVDGGIHQHRFISVARFSTLGQKSGVVIDITDADRMLNRMGHAAIVGRLDATDQLGHLLVARSGLGPGTIERIDPVEIEKLGPHVVDGGENWQRVVVAEFATNNTDGFELRGNIMAPVNRGNSFGEWQVPETVSKAVAAIRLSPAVIRDIEGMVRDGNNHICDQLVDIGLSERKFIGVRDRLEGLLSTHGS